MYTNVKDYLGELKEEFNDVPLKDIKRIIEYGWRKFYYYTLYGCDITIKNNNFWFHCGKLTCDSLRHFNYYKRKLRRKLRVMYKNKKIKWNGCYYTYISDEEYDTIINSRKSKKNFAFKNRMCFKILDEAKLFYYNKHYLIEFKYPISLGYSFKKDILKLNQRPNILFIRDHHLNFKELLISNNKYSVL